MVWCKKAERCRAGGSPEREREEGRLEEDFLVPHRGRCGLTRRYRIGIACDETLGEAPVRNCYQDIHPQRDERIRQALLTTPVSTGYTLLVVSVCKFDYSSSQPMEISLQPVRDE